MREALANAKRGKVGKLEQALQRQQKQDTLAKILGKKQEDDGGNGRPTVKLAVKWTQGQSGEVRWTSPGGGDYGQNHVKFREVMLRTIQRHERLELFK